ncbi:hypothetical protein THAOC_35062, partial [Thalassiosira oceanica]
MGIGRVDRHEGASLQTWKGPRHHVCGGVYANCTPANNKSLFYQ